MSSVPESRLTREEAELVAERGSGLIAKAHCRVLLRKAEKGEVKFADEEGAASGG